MYFEQLRNPAACWHYSKQASRAHQACQQQEVIVVGWRLGQIELTLLSHLAADVCAAAAAAVVTAL
jgi:hypothetical protein